MGNGQLFVEAKVEHIFIASSRNFMAWVFVWLTWDPRI